MSDVFLMNDRSETLKLERLRCQDESRELQDLLEKNLNLLPGEQIDPENPRRWLMVKREMPVPDPSTGDSRWSIDFILTDQFGIPTLVECKRCNDPRARREVVGQMFEYAANGQYYWSAAELKRHAEAAHGGSTSLEAKLRDTFPQLGKDAEQYFAQVERNLREAKLRLIFLLEESSPPLRSIVDFLNKQLKDTEVLLVEARQYRQGGTRIVVPWLFGYTEQARVAKRESREETVQSSAGRGPDAFWEAVASALQDEERLAILRQFIEAASSTPGCVARWVSGCTFQFPAVKPNRALFGVRRNGSLELYFGEWNADTRAENQPSRAGEVTSAQVRFRQLFARKLGEVLRRTFDEGVQRSFPQVKAAEWLPHVSELTQLIAELARESSGPAV